MTRLPEWSEELLKATSRSFYRTMAVLPAAVRPQISLAYLLARTSDTIADTELVPVTARLEALERLRGRILGETGTPLALGALAVNGAAPAEKQLLERAGDIVGLLDPVQDADRRLIREVLDIIIGGQALDLKRFPPPGPGVSITSLESETDLDDYAWRVAGCVGQFWTRLCRLHLFANAPLDIEALVRDGIRFGKGLQYVNILRDLPRDLRNGRCYLPARVLAEAGLAPADLLLPENMGRFRPVYDRFLDLTQAHLEAGWNYALALPAGQFRLRLACAWPILIGAATLRRLREGNVLDGSHRIKVTRSEVRNLIFRSVLYYPCPPLWRGQFAAETRK